MKKIKKILAIVLTIAMVFGTQSFALADGEEEGLPNLVLDGGEEGASTMIGHFDAPTKRNVPTDDYKYQGFASFLDMVPDLPIEDGNYRYLVMEYTGDITQLRFEFNRVTNPETGEQELQGPFWFNPEGQTCYFVTYDGSEIPLIGDNTFIVIDLLNSVHPADPIDADGVDLSWYTSGIHMHCDEMVTHGDGAGYDITQAYLTDSLDKIVWPEPDTEPDTEPVTEPVTEPDTEPVTETDAPQPELPDVIVLDEGDGGGFCGHSITSAADGWQYGGYVYLKGATADYKYLQLTYTGSLANDRFEIIGDDIYWFDTWQANKFVDVNGNDFDTSYSDEARTIVIDLEKSGVALGYGEGLHIHTENLATNGGVNFIDGRLLKSYVPEPEPVTEPDTEPETQEPETEPVTEPETQEPETEAPAEPVAVVEGEDYNTADTGVSVKNFNDEDLVCNIASGTNLTYTITVPEDGYYRFDTIGAM
ncbi:MAG: hypothetical protein IJM37_07775, partial [Lachnospiraceae bacterium]|nr:hypothetical protein [Lachnospiraceae bacterium]